MTAILKSENAATVSQNTMAQMSPMQLLPERLAGYTEIIDARTPTEFAEDHIPGAINLPVLDNEERIRIGTLHKQASAFEAKKAGAALVSRHIADYLEAHFSGKPINYKPLIYCWRGGNRSGALAHVLLRIGFKAEQLEGGYKAFRRLVIAELETLPHQFNFITVCGPTGSGKSRLLQALHFCGAQVLDLEDLAAHRGSLLGGLPDQPQPSQKKLESAIWWKLRGFNPEKPVFVESESKKIGNLHLPDTLLGKMRSASSLWLEASIEQRVQLLLEDYSHFPPLPDMLLEKISHLLDLRGHEVITRWGNMICAAKWPEFVRDMLETHYDPAYQKSLTRNYSARNDGDFSPSDTSQETFSLTGIQKSDFTELAKRVLVKC